MGEIEDDMIGWHHQLNGHEFEQTSRNSEGQGSLAFLMMYFAYKLKSRVTICSLDVLLSQFGRNPLFHLDF